MVGSWWLRQRRRGRPRLDHYPCFGYHLLIVMDIKDLLNNYDPRRRPKSRVQGPLHEVLGLIYEMTGETRYMRLYNGTKGLSVEVLWQLYREAQKGREPKKLFWYLVKKHKDGKIQKRGQGQA